MNKFAMSFAAAAMAALSGCNGDVVGETDTSLLAQGTKVLLGRFFGGSNDQPAIENFDIATTFGPEELATMTVPTLAGHLAKRDAWSGMTLVMERDGFRDFFTQDGIGFTFRQGVLVSTRGITGDLYASSVGPVVAALASRGTSQPYSRRQRFLLASATFEDHSYSCTMSAGPVESFVVARANYTAQRFDENCRGDSGQITNHYWRSGQNGKIIRSHQWVSEIAGYLDIYTLKE